MDSDDSVSTTSSSLSLSGWCIPIIDSEILQRLNFFIISSVIFKGNVIFFSNLIGNNSKLYLLLLKSVILKRLIF